MRGQNHVHRRGTDVQTDRQIDRQTEKQTDGQAETNIPPNFVCRGGGYNKCLQKQ